MNKILSVIAGVAVSICSMVAMAQDCISPKYARDALRKLYLEQQFPGMDEIAIRRKVAAKLGEDKAQKLLSPTNDVIACFMAGHQQEYCPKEKRGLRPADHYNLGLKIFLSPEYKDVITPTETVFLEVQLNVWIQEAQCQDH